MSDHPLFGDAAFDARLQRCLDDGVDPLDDRAICDWLLEHPDALPAVAQLRERLQGMAAAGAPPAAATARRRLVPRIAVLSAATVALCGMLLRGAGSAPPTPAPVGRLVSWSVHQRDSGHSAAVTAHRAVADSTRLRIRVTDTWRILR
ncbi:MAG: hypothetical protein AB7O97_00205 [Planctomycetota bacterium]